MAGGSRASTLVAIHRGGEKRSRLRMSESHGQALHADIVESSSLYNKDLAPVRSERRLWRTYNYAALWISMSVNIPTYMLASGMIAGEHVGRDVDAHGDPQRDRKSTRLNS